MSNIDPNSIKSISVWKDKPEYPYGVLEIETKPETGIHNTKAFTKPKKYEQSATEQ